MSAYYNENDPKAAAWLRELIARGLIAAGEVDERSIEDVTPNDVRGFTQCHFFAGIGGWSLALRIAGWPDSRPVWTGSCPCQPFSAAGKGAGFADERHLWPAWFHLIAQCRPAVVFGEQVASAAGHGWIDLVQADLEGQGYAVGHHVLGAHSVGAPHIRQRTWYVADPDGSTGQRRAGGVLGTKASEYRARELYGCEPDRPANGGKAVELANAYAQRQHSPSWPGLHHQEHNAESRGGMGDAERHGQRGCWRSFANVAHQSSHWSVFDLIECRDGKARPVEPGSFPLADGIPARVVRLRGYGNAIVPEVAAAFIEAAVECGVGANHAELSEAA